MEHIINIPKLPLHKKHIAWVVKEDQDNLLLQRVVECFYEHPEAPEWAKISRIEIEQVKKVNKNSKEAAPLFQLLNGEKTIDLIYGEE